MPLLSEGEVLLGFLDDVSVTMPGSLLGRNKPAAPSNAITMSTQWPMLRAHERAMLISQRGPLAGTPVRQSPC